MSGSGEELLTCRLLPTEDEFLTHPEYALCLPIGPEVRVAVISMLLFHWGMRDFERKDFLPKKLSTFCNLWLISSRVSSVVTNAVSATLNSTLWRNLGLLKLNSFSSKELSFQKYLNLRNFNITVSDDEHHTFQKDWLRVSSAEGEYALHDEELTGRFFPFPTNNRVSERASMDNVFLLLAIYLRVLELRVGLSIRPLKRPFRKAETLYHLILFL